MAYATPTLAAKGSTNGTSVTSDAFDSTASDAIAVWVASQSPESIVITDSAGNSTGDYVGATVRNSGAGAAGRWYVINLSGLNKSATHTITATGTFPAIVVVPLVGAYTVAAPLDQQNGATFSGATSGATGSVTPAYANEIVLAGVALNNTNTPTISAPFSAVVGAAGDANNYGAFAAYEIQVAPTARNPTWSWTGTGSNAVAIITLRAMAAHPVSLITRLTPMGLSGRRNGSFAGKTAAGAVTLTAEVGSFTLTGQDVNLLYGRKLTADAGAFTLAGQDAGLLHGRRLDAEQGTFALTGQVAGLLHGRLLTAEVGGFTLSGQDAVMVYGRAIVAEASAFVLTGIAADLLRTRILTAGAGTFALTGMDVTLTAGAAVVITGGICQQVTMFPGIQQAAAMGGGIQQVTSMIPPIQQVAHMGCNDGC